MAQKIVCYNLMIAHSNDTSELVPTVKRAVNEFCELFRKFNFVPIDFDVHDFSDSVYSTHKQQNTQSIVFEQFAGRTDMAIALIGERIGSGLKEELEAFMKEKKQVFVYLYDKGLSVYNSLGNAKQSIEEIMGVVTQFNNTGYAKIFSTKEELANYIIDDIALFLKHRRRTKYELSDITYSSFAYDEVDRYRNEIINAMKAHRKNTQQDESDDCNALLHLMVRHSHTNITELLRLFREIIADEYDLDYTDITVSFVWGYHDWTKDSETLILPNSKNVVSLNHSGTPAKLPQLLKQERSLLRYVILQGYNYKWYQYKSFACSKKRYWWPDNEVSVRAQCRKKFTCESCNDDGKDRCYGGSIFCYKIVLNGDAAKTNNFAVGYIMVSTYKKPITNTVHDAIRDEVKQSIKHLIDYRVKPQLLVELAQLYLAQVFSGKPQVEENADCVTGGESILLEYEKQHMSAS